MGIYHYKLDENNNPKPCSSKDWERFISKYRKVNFTDLGHVQISTVFLGIDHGDGLGRPLLFETMVFGGKMNGHQERYSTWKEAETGHNRIVSKIIGKPDGTI